MEIRSLIKIRRSVEEPDDHVGAWLRLKPSRLRRSGDSFVSNRKNGLYGWLPDQEDGLMLEQLVLADDSRDILQLSEDGLVQELCEDLLLQSMGRHHLESISRGGLEVDAVDFLL